MLNYKHLQYFLQVAKTGSVSRAAEKLHLTPQTLSGQIRTLEARLGAELFQRKGRKLELTRAGKLALHYADEIFRIGTELEESLGESRGTRMMPFRVGISDAVPKTIAHRLLMPALGLEEPVKLICRENRLERLVAELGIHRLDMVLANKPMPTNIDVKGYSHLLGECGVAFFASKALARTLGPDFPANLDGMPLLLPGEDSALRVPLLRWLEKRGLTPRIAGEFDDSALMKSFGEAGLGVFPSSAVIADEVEGHYRVMRIGQTDEIRERYFAISAERHVRHPAVLAMSKTAHGDLFR
jgi:LysR family transcriptional activator of nhaA